jgi:hypothetical protein
VPPVFPTAGVPQGAHFIREWGAPRSSYSGGTPGSALRTGVGCPPFFLLRGYPGSAKLVLGRPPPAATPPDPPVVPPVLPTAGVPRQREARTGAPPSCGDSAGPSCCAPRSSYCGGTPAARSSYWGAPLLRRLRRTLLLCPPFFLLRGYPGSAKLVLGRPPPAATPPDPPVVPPVLPTAGVPRQREARTGAPPSCGDSAGPSCCAPRSSYCGGTPAARSSYWGAPLLRRLRRTLLLCPPFFLLRGYPGSAKLVLGRPPPAATPPDPPVVPPVLPTAGVPRQREARTGAPPSCGDSAGPSCCAPRSSYCGGTPAARSSYWGAPLLRRLRRTLPLCPPFFLLRGYPGSAELVLGCPPFFLQRGYPGSAKLVLGCPQFSLQRGYPGSAKLVLGRPPSCGGSALPSWCTASAGTEPWRPASLCPPFFLLRGYPRERISYGSGAPAGNEKGAAIGGSGGVAAGGRRSEVKRSRAGSPHGEPRTESPSEAAPQYELRAAGVPPQQEERGAQ